MVIFTGTWQPPGAYAPPPPRGARGWRRVGDRGVSLSSNTYANTTHALPNPPQFD